MFAWSAVPPERPSRRRDRKRESRSRHAPEYEEVPGGGQFLLMLLNREGGKRSNLPRRGHGPGDGWTEGDRGIGGDPAILHAVSASGSSAKSEHRVGKDAVQHAQLRSMPPQVDSPNLISTSASLKRKQSPDALLRERGTTSSGEHVDLIQSLLECAGITEIGMDLDGSADATGRQSSQVSKASSKVSGKLQSRTDAHEDAKLGAPRPGPLIPPMPGFSAIWGAPPGGGPTSSPAQSPWAPQRPASAAEEAGSLWTPPPPRSPRGDRGLPEFFRDCAAPPFQEFALEARGAGSGGGAADTRWLSAEDDDDDVVSLGRQLLG